MTRAVYDSMVFFQWATLPPEQPQRQHATVTALVNNSIRLCLGPELFLEVRNVLLRPELQAKYKTLTPEHVAAVLAQAKRFADWFENVPKHFSYPGHEKDDHVLNLVIESKARYLVTWENRLQRLMTDKSEAAETFRRLAHDVSILSPADFAAELKVQREHLHRHTPKS